MHIVNETMYYLRLFLNSAGFIEPGVLLRRSFPDPGSGTKALNFDN